MAAVVEDVLEFPDRPKPEEVKASDPIDNISVNLDEITLDPTNIDPQLMWRAESVIEYFLSLEKLVPLYGNFVPQYPRRPTSGRKLTPRDFGVKEDSSGGGGGTGKGLRGDEQMKDKAMNQFRKTGKYK